MKRRSILPIVITATASLLISLDKFGSAYADTIDLFDGSRLTGRVEEMSHAGVKFVSESDANVREISVQDATSISLVPVGESETTSDAQPQACRLLFVDGGSVDGELTSWRENEIEFSPRSDHVPSLSVPTSAVRSIQFGSGQESASRQPTEEDVVVAKVNERRNTEIKGDITGVSDGRLSVVYKGKQRGINLDRLVAIYPANSKASSAHKTYLLAKIDAHCVVPTRVSEVDQQTVILKTLWGQQLQISRTISLDLSVQNGRIQLLSAFDPLEVIETPFLDRTVHWKRNQALDGKPIKLQDRTYTNGIAMHSKTEMRFGLAGKYDRFMSVVGIDPRMKKWGDAEIEVHADGQRIYKKRLRGTDAPLRIELSVAGAKELTLVTDFGSGQDVGDQVLWANARLVRSVATTTGN